MPTVEVDLWIEGIREGGEGRVRGLGAGGGGIVPGGSGLVVAS